MRYISYKSGFNLPCISCAEDPSSIGDIVGGEIRKDGSILLHMVVRGADEVVVIPNGCWHKSLEEAMEQRYAETVNHRNPYSMIKPAVDSRIVAQPDSVLWAMELDPEPTEEDWSLNHRIKILRQVLQLTKVQFADKIGIHWIKLEHIETNCCGVSYDIVKSIIQVFGVREPWISRGSGNIFEKEVQNEQQSRW